MALMIPRSRLKKWKFRGGTLPSGNYPAWTAQSGVVALWHFSETSGSIVDVVSGITLAEGGSPVHSVVATDEFADWSPGITYTSNTEHAKATATASLNLGATSHLVLEAGIKRTGTGTEYLCSFNGNASSTDYGILFYFNGTTSFNAEYKMDDATTLAHNFTIPDLNDGKLHKIRYILNRTADTAKVGIDGAYTATQSAAAIAGKAQTNAGFRAAGQFNGGAADFIGTIFEMSVAIGTGAEVLSVNQGGPGGG